MDETRKRPGRKRTDKFLENSAYASTISTVDGGTGNPLVDAKLANLMEDTKAKALKNAIIMRDYVSIAEVADVVGTEFTRVRQKILTLETKLPHVLATITDPHEIKRIIGQEVNEILEELSADGEYQKTYEDNQLSKADTGTVQ
jgi:hypothetical protein